MGLISAVYSLFTVFRSERKVLTSDCLVLDEYGKCNETSEGKCFCFFFLWWRK